MKLKIIVILNFVATLLAAQFPGPVATIGTTAMHKDSIAFVAWGKMCNITRGYQDISNTSLGKANVGDSSKAILKADGSVVSLGDGGIAIITFSAPITNSPGYDFAVFENSFNDTFLELAFVEVSSDGANYYRFPPTSNSQYTVQYNNAASIDATKLDNLAGKYRSLYGTPFDLQELVSIPQLNVNAITHVKIIDVVGSINTLYATYDKNSNIINDPWPTAFGSSGFDLDGVGVIHQSPLRVNEFKKESFVSIYPNPFSSKFKVQNSKFSGKTVLKIFDLLGNEIKNFELHSEITELDLSDLNSGVYFVHIESGNHQSVTKLIKD